MHSLTKSLSGPIITPEINQCGPFHRLGKFIKVGSICSSALLFSHKPDSLPSSSPSDGSSSNCFLQNSLRSERLEPSTRNSRCCKSIGVLDRHDKPLDGLPQLPRVELANLNRNGTSSKRIVKKHDSSKTTNRSHRRIKKSGSFNERNVTYRVAKKKHNKRVSKPLPSMIGRRKLSRRNKKSKLNDLFFHYAINQEEPDIGTVEHAGVQGGGNKKREEEFDETELLQRQDGQDVEVQSQQNGDTLWSRGCAQWKRMPTWKKTVAVAIPTSLIIGIGTTAYLSAGANSNLSPASASHGNESINNYPSPAKEGMASTGVPSDVYPMNPHVQPENATLTVDQNDNSSTVKNDKTTDVNPPNRDNGQTPLMEADGNSSTVKNDKTTDANLPILDNGRTQLMEAAANGNLQVVEKLIESKANVDQKNEFGYTALMLAAQHGRLEVVGKLIGAEANVDQRNAYGETALTIAAYNNHLEIVEKLIGAKANVDQRNAYGETALMIAARHGHHGVVEKLIGAKANVDLSDNDGWTALMRAAQNDYLQIVEKLIAAKADVNLENNDGNTALVLARRYKYSDIEDLLNQEPKAEMGVVST